MVRQQSAYDRIEASFYRAEIERIVGHASTAIVCALGDRSMRFVELADELPFVSQDAINISLRELDRDGIVSRRVDPGPPLRVLYELTLEGSALQPALGALTAWMRREEELASR
jgi:DNA-binding HxlR family transcriptional regulator